MFKTCWKNIEFIQLIKIFSAPVVANSNAFQRLNIETWMMYLCSVCNLKHLGTEQDLAIKCWVYTIQKVVKPPSHLYWWGKGEGLTFLYSIQKYNVKVMENVEKNILHVKYKLESSQWPFQCYFFMTTIIRIFFGHCHQL